MTAANPERLGRYEIVEELGRGAMGTVFLAQDPLLGRLLALKTFIRLGDVEAADRSHRSPAPLHEAQAAALLSHPNIVSIHDLEEDPAAGPFIAMEYVRGSDLQEILEPRAPLPADFVLHVVCEAAAALDYAHSRGVVHGDIKPANLLIGDREEVKITDFGVARRGGNAGPNGDSFATPGYASPEQILGGPVDHRTDIFALGVVLFEMLTGHRPFAGRTASEVLRQIVRASPGTLLEDRDGLGAEVREVVLTALAKDPEDRFRSAGELAAALRRAMDTAEPGAEAGATQDLSELFGPLETGPLQLDDGARVTPPRGAVGALLEKLRGSVSLQRLGRGLTAALLACCALGSLALARVVAVGGGAGTVVEGHAERQRYLPLVREGRRLLRSGEPEQAARLFRRAESIVPGELSLTRLRRRAEQEAADLAAYGERERQIAALLAEGRRLLELGLAEQARRPIERALALDPGHRDALELAARGAALELQRARTDRRAGAQRVARSAAPGNTATRDPASGPSTPSTPPIAVTRYARLEVDFFSQVSKGVLIIYAGTEQIVRQPFRFFHRSSWLRRRPISGRMEVLRQLPAGRVPLRVYLASDTRESSSVALEVDLKAGRTTVLRLAADRSGELSFDLN